MRLNECLHILVSCSTCSTYFDIWSFSSYKTIAEIHYSSIFESSYFNCFICTGQGYLTVRAMIYIFKLKLNKKHKKSSSLYLPTSYHRIVTDCLVIKWKRQNMPSHIAHYNIYLNDFLNIFLVHRLNGEWKHFYTVCSIL